MKREIKSLEEGFSKEEKIKKWSDLKYLYNTLSFFLQ